VYGWRRLCAGDERRDGHRARHGYDLSRQAAAGESGDWRSHDAAPEAGILRPQLLDLLKPGLDLFVVFAPVVAQKIAVYASIANLAWQAVGVYTAARRTIPG
jgi:hypothetical protein